VASYGLLLSVVADFFKKFLVLSTARRSPGGPVLGPPAAHEHVPVALPCLYHSFLFSLPHFFLTGSSFVSPVLPSVPFFAAARCLCRIVFPLPFWHKIGFFPVFFS